MVLEDKFESSSKAGLYRCQLITNEMEIGEEVNNFIQSLRLEWACDPYRTVCVCGTNAAEKAILANDLFGAMSQASNVASNRYLTASARFDSVTREKTTPPVIVQGACMYKVDRECQLVIELEGFSLNRVQFSNRERQLAKLGVLLADVVLYTIDYHDIQNDKANIIQQHLSQLVTLYNSSYLYCPSKPRMGLVIAVLNYKCQRHSETEAVKRKVCRWVESAMCPSLQGFSANLEDNVRCVCHVLQPRQDQLRYNRDLQRLEAQLRSQDVCRKPSPTSSSKQSGVSSPPLVLPAVEYPATSLTVPIDFLEQYIKLVWKAIRQNIQPCLSHFRDLVLKNSHLVDGKVLYLDESTNLTRGLRDFAYRKCIKDIRQEEDNSCDRDTTPTHSEHVSRAVKYFVDLCESKGAQIEREEIHTLILDLAKRISRIHIRKVRGYLQQAHKKCQPALKRANRCHEAVTKDWEPEVWLELASQLKFWQHLFIKEVAHLTGKRLGVLVVQALDEKLEISLKDPAGSGSTVTHQMIKALSDTFARPWDANRRLIRSKFGEELDRCSPRAKRRLFAMLERTHVGDLLGTIPHDMLRAARHLTTNFGTVLFEYRMLRSKGSVFEQILAEVIRYFQQSLQEQDCAPHTLFLHRWEYVCRHPDTFSHLGNSVCDIWKFTFAELMPALMGIGERLTVFAADFGLNSDCCLGPDSQFGFTRDELLTEANLAQRMSITKLTANDMEMDLNGLDIESLRQANDLLPLTFQTPESIKRYPSVTFQPTVSTSDDVVMSNGIDS